MRMRPNWPGRDQPVGVGEHGPAADRAAALVDHVVDEVHRALVRPAVLVDQMGMRRWSPLSRVEGSSPRWPRRADRRGSPTPTCRRSGRSDRAGRSWSSSVWSLTRLPMSTRRSEMRPANGAVTRVKPRLSSACAQLRPGCRRALALASASSALRSSSVAWATAEVVTSLLRAVLVELRPASSCALRLLDLRLGPVDGRLVGARVDDEQHLAGLDDLRRPGSRSPAGSRRPGHGSSTCCTGSNRPVNSSHSVSFWTSGLATVTSGGGGAGLGLRRALLGHRRSRRAGATP